MATHARQQDDRYFQVHGLSPRPPATLNKALRRAIDTMHRTIYAPSSQELTPPETALLEGAGADLGEHPDLRDPMMAYATTFGAMLATSVSAVQAAKRFRVTSVRIRQMIRDGTLYAVRVEGRWAIPIFQFEKKGLVPNIGPVNAALARTLDPVSILHWYTTPDAELETAAGDALSPLAWLKAGRDPAPVARIARDL